MRRTRCRATTAAETSPFAHIHIFAFGTTRAAPGTHWTEHFPFVHLFPQQAASLVLYTSGDVQDPLLGAGAYWRCNDSRRPQDSETVAESG